MIQIPENIESLGREALLKFALEVKNQQLLVNFNEYNRLRFSPPPTPEGVEKLPKPPLPFSSWFEYRMFNTHLEKLDYEPISIDYVRKHKYTPDSVVPGTNLLIELKGAFEKDEPGKYQAIHEQSGYAFLFVFQRRGTEIAWKKPRKDGTRLLHEEWCAYHYKKGLPFYCTFEDEFEDFKKSRAFQEIFKRHKITQH